MKAVRIYPWIGAVGVVHENSLLAIEDHAAFALERDVVGKKVRPRRVETTVEPKELDGRLRPASRELIMHG
jgi:hypothetical protein